MEIENFSDEVSHNEANKTLQESIKNRDRNENLRRTLNRKPHKKLSAVFGELSFVDFGMSGSRRTLKLRTSHYETYIHGQSIINKKILVKDFLP